MHKIYGTNDITGGSALTLLIDNIVYDNTTPDVYVYADDEYGTISGDGGVVMHDANQGGVAARRCAQDEISGSSGKKRKGG